MKTRDIRSLSDNEKFQIYSDINVFAQLGRRVRIRHHPSGFPAIIIECNDVRIITDILSLEGWSARRKASLEDQDRGSS